MSSTANTPFFFKGGLCYLTVVDLGISIFDSHGFGSSRRTQRSMSCNNLLFCRGMLAWDTGASHVFTEIHVLVAPISS